MNSKSSSKRSSSFSDDHPAKIPYEPIDDDEIEVEDDDEIEVEEEEEEDEEEEVELPINIEDEDDDEEEISSEDISKRSRDKSIFSRILSLFKN